MSQCHHRHNGRGFVCHAVNQLMNIAYYTEEYTVYVNNSCS